MSNEEYIGRLGYLIGYVVQPLVRVVDAKIIRRKLSFTVEPVSGRGTIVIDYRHIEFTDESDWEHIGDVGVDSGHLIMTDYPDQTEVQHAHELIGQMMPDLETCQREGIEHPPFFRQLNYEVGHAGAGVIVSAGIGDGFYPVFAKIGEVEGMGKRVKEVKVKFIPHPYFQDTEG